MMGRKDQKGQRGETQVGVILWMLGLGVAISVLMTLQSCIYSYKEGKLDRRREQWIERHRRPIEPEAARYSVRY